MVSADQVLIVDNSIAARDGVRKAISRVYPNASVAEAKTAEEGRQVFREKRPDLGILDVNVPGCDGLALAEELLEMNPDVRLMLCTANVPQPVADRAAAIGIPIIDKPMSSEKLRSVLQSQAALNQGPLT